MASYYVYSGAAGAGTGADWANAYTTLSLAVAGKAAGDIFYIAHDHGQSVAASLTITSPGTPALLCQYLSVNRAGSVPPVSADLRTTSAITTTGASPINMRGSFYAEGIVFNIGTGASAAVSQFGETGPHTQIYKNCSPKQVTTHATTRLELGADLGNLIVFDNTAVTFGGISQTIRPACNFIWKNTASALLGSVPTNLFGFNTSSGVVDGFKALLMGVDLSAMGSGKTIVPATANGSGASFTFVDCKIDAAVTLAGNPTSPGGVEIDFIRTAGSGINYSQARYRYQGTLTEETTIVRTGGASDGTTPLAWKIVTTANAHWFAPFECPPIAIWNDTTGSAVTATVEGIWGGGAVPNDDEIWCEVEYLGNASFPIASFVNDSKADVLAAAAGQSAGSGTWGGSTTKFKLNVTFTPQMKGWIFLRVKAAKASSTFYIDPKITLS